MNVAFFYSDETGSGKSERHRLAIKTLLELSVSNPGKKGPQGMFSDCSGIFGSSFVYPVIVLASQVICDDTYSNKSCPIAAQVPQGMFFRPLGNHLFIFIQPSCSRPSLQGHLRRHLLQQILFDRHSGARAGCRSGRLWGIKSLDYYLERNHAVAVPSGE